MAVGGITRERPSSTPHRAGHCALLEVLANAGELAGDYIIIPIEITDELAITTVSIEMLHPDWNRGEPTQQTRNIGTEWVKSLRSAVLVVPSAIIPQEQNYVLNPSHPDFREIRFGSPEPFYFDDRLQKREGKRALR